MDPYNGDRDHMASLFDMRLRFGLSLSSGRPTRPKGEFHARMAERWVSSAIELGRPPYTEAAGFTKDRWQLGGSELGGSVCGHEKPYGFCSRPFWRYVRLAMREAFLSGWHDALGTTMPDHRGARNSLHMARITGLTS